MKIDAEQGCRSNLFRILFFKSGKIYSYNPAMTEDQAQPTSDIVGGGRVAAALLTAILAVSAASIFIR
ncbi:MAG TPA: hypothetical protein VHP14_21360, partial [Anaerolineales bacterium]|nr:hypothetical protein [Anaerolineales bacterium]